MDNLKYVQLGDHTYPVVPQKHARLRHHLSGGDFQAIFGREYAANSYRILTILIPAVSKGVMSLDSDGYAVPPYPLWEWEGFTSQEALEDYQAGNRDAYDEDNDPSPTGDQIAAAIEAALQVNGAGRVGKLLNLITTAGSLATQETETLSSPVSRGTNGESLSTPTSTPTPTSTENED